MVARLSRAAALADSVWGELPEVEYCDGGYFVAAPRFNCHLSVREPGREFLYKPNCKVSTAAACEANLITTRDLTTVELLGEDYPYYCEPERGSILAAIERARAAFGTAGVAAGPRAHAAGARADPHGPRARRVRGAAPPARFRRDEADMTATVCYFIQSHRDPEQIYRLVRTLRRGSPRARIVVQHNSVGCDLDRSPLAACPASS